MVIQRDAAVLDGQCKNLPPAKKVKRSASPRGHDLANSTSPSSKARTSTTVRRMGSPKVVISQREGSLSPIKKSPGSKPVGKGSNRSDKEEDGNIEEYGNDLPADEPRTIIYSKTFTTFLRKQGPEAVRQANSMDREREARDRMAKEKEEATKAEDPYEAYMRGMTLRYETNQAQAAAAQANRNNEYQSISTDMDAEQVSDEVNCRFMAGELGEEKQEEVDES